MSENEHQETAIDAPDPDALTTATVGIVGTILVIVAVALIYAMLMSDDDATAVVDAAWDAGIRYFDTAPLYGHGLSEQRVGHALARRPSA